MEKRGLISISGVSDSRTAPIISKITREGQSLIIVANEKRAKELAVDLSFFSDKKVFILPSENQLFINYEARNRDNVLKRLKILKALESGEEVIIISTAQGVMRKVPPKRIMEESSFKLSLGEKVSLETIKEKLFTLGYETMSMVEEEGEISFRGGILDIYVPGEDNPFRIEFFGDEIDSIRAFDPDSQRSLGNVKYIEVYQSREILQDKENFLLAARNIEREYDKEIKKLKNKNQIENLVKRKNQLKEQVENMVNMTLMENYIHYFYKDLEYIWDYSENIIIDEPQRVYEAIQTYSKELKEDFTISLERGLAIPKDMGLVIKEEDFRKIYSKERVYMLMTFPKAVKGAGNLTEVHSIISRQMVSFNGRMDVLEGELKTYVSKRYKINIVLRDKEKIENFKEFVNRIGLIDKVSFHLGDLSSGMDFPEDKVCYICERDIFGQKKISSRERKKKTSKKSQEVFFSDLKQGDYIVHENHGIGKFLGIKELVLEGEKKDYLQIKYAGNDMLYVPVEQMDFVQKYVGADGVTPKINKLTGGEWKVTKAKAKAAIAEMATELLEILAKRKMEKGFEFGEDTVWQHEFEESFPFEETDDQLRAVGEIKKDMEAPFAMDRLLCGDVGFGKTEVAARAIFKCLGDGRQAAVLVPTTILANQHYYTLKERFENFPMKVEMLSRFRSPKEQKEIVDKVKKGEIDLIIGTHRILSQDVKFKDLGLLVIDEEQRFGVEHKEKIKKLRANVDVLTLSATPIPRTLNMSLSGLKPMSVIEEPPEERLPVQTYVMEEEDYIIKDVIERELNRGGQVFVVYNRVKGILSLADKIRKLVPDAKVAVGHGQMNEHSLENIMVDFVNGETQILVSTTIIETGIDIPNANTMIILDADKFGLSQLYQLKGRVGRSTRMAYAYLMHQKGKHLTEVAEKRLKAIKDFTEFGSGFKVAMRDLEIRGAGNILGAQQSGHMMNIGYELYCRLVDDAVKALKGEIVKERKEELTIELILTANIPSWYINDEEIKLQMYKKIATIEKDEDLDEIFDELLDRFGDVPRETENLLLLSQIRSIAGDVGVKRIYESQKKIMITFEKDNMLKGKTLMAVNQEFGQKVFIHGGKEPFLRLSSEKNQKLKDILSLMKLIDNRGEKNVI